jgi:hypothetical protein
MELGTYEHGLSRTFAVLGNSGIIRVYAMILSAIGLTVKDKVPTFVIAEMEGPMWNRKQRE